MFQRDASKVPFSLAASRVGGDRGLWIPHDDDPLPHTLVSCPRQRMTAPFTDYLFLRFKFFLFTPTTLARSKLRGLTRRSVLNHAHIPSNSSLSSFVAILLFCGVYFLLSFVVVIVEELRLSPSISTYLPCSLLNQRSFHTKWGWIQRASLPTVMASLSSRCSSSQHSLFLVLCCVSVMDSSVQMDGSPSSPCLSYVC